MTFCTFASILGLIVCQGEPVQNRSERPVVAQVIGATCQTVIGTCPVSPQPIGTACACGLSPGYVRQ